MALTVLCTPAFGQTTATKSCEIRGQVATGDFEWNAQNFAGFYYDIDNDLGTEKITITTTDGYRLSGDAPYGVTYTTTAQTNEYEFEDWGSYKVIGFLAEKYFAGYNEAEYDGSNIFFKESTDENSLSSEQLEKILIDDDTEKTVTSNTPVKLAEGYELVIKLIDASAMYLELTKNGQVVDSRVISPSRESATMADKTYYYRNPAVGDQKNLITIGVHFKNAINIQNQTVATVDGIWQISETPTNVEAYTQYDMMTISSVDGNNGIIIMENKDNYITLSKNKNIVLMGGIKIKTANNDALRYYIYSEENCQCG